MDKNRCIKVVGDFLEKKNITDDETKNTVVDYVFSHYGLKSDQEISDLDIKIMSQRYLDIQAKMPEGKKYEFSTDLM